MTDKTKEILTNSTVINNSIKLPALQLDRKEYEDVKKTIEKMGGKWKGGSVCAFVFTINPSELLQEVLGGEKVNRKKEFQFFATPKKLVEKMVYLADINKKDILLEPSGGQGAIIEVINEKFPEIKVNYFELMPENRIILESKNLNCKFLGEDFLSIDTTMKFDKIIANPPFTKNQDIEHLMKMYECLNENGVIVCITSCSWYIGNTKKQNEFKQWLKNVNAETEEIEEGTFKESKTNVKTILIKIKK